MPRRPAPRAPRFAVSAVALLAAVGSLAGCSESEPGTAARSIEIYQSVLTWVLEHEVPMPAEDDRDDVGNQDDRDTDTDTDTEPDGNGNADEEPVEVPPVFVDKFGSQIDLQVQVELVSRFEEQGYQLRFLDTRSEALDEDQPDAPVRDDAVLVGLGPIPDGSPVDVRAEIYRDSEDMEAYRFRLARFAGEWSFLEDPTPVEPEGFVADP